MVVINGYLKKWDDEASAYQIHGNETSVCPLCSGFLWRFGKRCRTIVENCGSKTKLFIQRLKCKLCGKIHHELPDIVTPYKRYSTEAVEKIIAGDTDEVACEDSTIRRIRVWWASCRLHFESVITSLTLKYGARFPGGPAPREMIRAAANANLWPSTRSAFLSA